MNSLGSGQSLPTNTIKLADQLCVLVLVHAKVQIMLVDDFQTGVQSGFPILTIHKVLIWMFPSINTKPDQGTLRRWTNVVAWNFNSAKLQPTFGPQFPNSDGLHRCTWAERSVDQWRIASTKKGFLSCKMCRITGKLCPTSCDFCNVFFPVGRSIMQEKNECYWVWPWIETMSFPSQYGVTVPFNF